MDLYDEIAAMQWKKSCQSEWKYRGSCDMTKVYDYLDSIVTNKKIKSFYMIRCPDAEMKDLQLVVIYGRPFQLCMIQPEKTVFIGDTEYDSQKFLGTLLRKCYGFLNSCTKGKEEQFEVKKLPASYYADYYRAVAQKNYFSLSSGDGTNLIIAFPSSEGSIWNCILSPDDRGGYVNMAAKYHYTHFVQTVLLNVCRMICEK